MAAAVAPGVVALQPHLPEAVVHRQGACTTHSVVAVPPHRGRDQPRNRQGLAHLHPGPSHSLPDQKINHPDRKAPLPAIASMEVHSAHPTAALVPAGLQAKIGLSTTPAKAGMPMCQAAAGPTILHATHQAHGVVDQPATAVTQNLPQEDHQAATGLPMPIETRAVTAVPLATAAREQEETPVPTEIQAATGLEATAPEATISIWATTTTLTSMPGATRW